MSLARLVGTLARCLVWMLKRDALTRKDHRGVNCPADGCMCMNCQWVRELEADEALGPEKWR